MKNIRNKREQNEVEYKYVYNYLKESDYKFFMFLIKSRKIKRVIKKIIKNRDIIFTYEETKMKGVSNVK